MNEFGRRLNFLRERKELSLSQLAEAIGTTKSALSRYENGLMDPKLNTMVKLAEYFNVTLDWIAGNGDFNQVQYNSQNDYIEIINKCVEAGIPKEKLEKLIEVLKE